MMTIKAPHIFKSYDIRGLAGSELDEPLVEAIGRAVGTYLIRHGQFSLAAGRDGRLSGPLYQELFMNGVRASGVDVIDIGICPTPVLYYALHRLQPGGGTAVTASHNPPGYNGFKICCGRETIFGEEIQSLRRMIETGDYESGRGSYSRHSILPDYLSFLTGHFGEFPGRPKVVVDAGHGTAGLVVPELLRRLKCRVIELYCDLDGTFPHHEADPTVEENLQDMIRLVREQEADLGIAFDGDGDRIGVVDAGGHILHGDQLLLLYARQVLETHPGATIISEVKSSRVLYDEIARLGGQPLMWKTGHSLIKAKMRETGAPLAGEMSGHMFFADRYFGYDDAIYAAGRLLEIITRQGIDLQAWREALPPAVNTPEIRVECPEPLKQPLVENLLGYYRPRFPVVDIDGVRVTFPDGWGLVRASNTQPVMVLRFEAASGAALEEIRRDMTGRIDGFLKGRGIS